MKLRVLLMVVMLVIPNLALADDMASSGNSAQQSLGASELLPQTGDTSGTSSTGASSYLQPNSSSLQGSSTDGSNLSAPTDQTLQAAPANDSLKVMLGGEADGTPHTLADDSKSLGSDLIDIAAGVLILCAAITTLRRRVSATNPVY